MSGELQAWGGGGIHRYSKDTVRAVSGIAATVPVAQAKVKAKGRVAEFTLWEITSLKRTQAELEQRNPDCAEALALIVNTCIASMAQTVAHYSSELD